MMGYDNPKMQLLLLLCFGLVITSLFIKRWRRKQKNAVTRKLSRSWGRIAMVFGVIGLILAVSRAEDISYISMRFWWVVWLCAFAFYFYVQVRIFRARHYEKLPKEQTEDPRERYLPNRKKRR